MLYYFLKKNSYTVSLGNAVIKPLMAGLVMAIFIYVFKNIDLILLMVTAAILYSALLYVFKAITAEDISLVKQAFRRGET